MSDQQRRRRHEEEQCAGGAPGSEDGSGLSDIRSRSRERLRRIDSVIDANLSEDSAQFISRARQSGGE